MISVSNKLLWILYLANKCLWDFISCSHIDGYQLPLGFSCSGTTEARSLAVARDYSLLSRMVHAFVSFNDWSGDAFSGGCSTASVHFVGFGHTTRRR